MKTFVLFILVTSSALFSNAQSSAGLQSDVSVGTDIRKPSFSTANNNNKLASFTASINNNKADLRWTTEIETNLSHIMVEKSIDGKNFKDAALVFTYGNTTARSDYAFADNISKIKTGSVYYRLRIVDADGSTQYSDTRIVEVSK